LSKVVYCSNCGHRSQIIRKAMPKFGTIIDLVEPHECSEEAQEFDLKVIDVPVYQKEVKGKFVQKLNELQPLPSTSRILLGVGDGELRDRREEQTNKSSAPDSLLRQMRANYAPTPTHPLKETENE
jgi:hypothetical protein